jgi:hypothetical protein
MSEVDLLRQTTSRPQTAPNSPKQLYVYDVEIVRHYDASGNPVFVRKQWDQLTVLHHIMRQVPHNNNPFFQVYNAITQALRNNMDSWVSDDSLIWSSVGLFSATHPIQSPAPIEVTPP